MKILNEVPPVAEKGSLACLDVETYGQPEGKVHRPTGTFACLSVTLDGKTVYQVYDEKQVRAVLRAVDKAEWVFHNALYDLTQLRRFALIKPRFIWDIMLVEQATTGGLYSKYSLKDLTRRYLGETMQKDVREEFATATSMTTGMKTYAGRDVVKTLAIARLQKREFDESPYLRPYTLVDEPMIFPLLDMPGISVDSEAWGTMVDRFETEGRAIEESLGFNVKSVPQCKAALAKAGVHVQSTGHDVLESFPHVPLAVEILRGRLYRDAVSKYGRKWLEGNVETDGKVYCAYRITGAETGRMSAANPSMMNIPQRKLPQYRAMFVPSKPGNVIAVWDIIQQEPRILAYESRDDVLKGAIVRGEDLHLSVARVVFGEADMDAHDPRRHIGKIINLGTTYGLSEYGLATRLNITEQEAAQFLQHYFARFRDVFLWIGKKRQEAYARGYVTTASGRRVFINPYTRQWENNAINAPIQGGAADLMKVWIRRMWEKFRAADLPFPVVAIVHDEVVMDIAKTLVPKAKCIASDALTEAAALLCPGIPFAADVAMGRSWACKKLSSEVIEEDGDE